MNIEKIINAWKNSSKKWTSKKTSTTSPLDEFFHQKNRELIEKYKKNPIESNLKNKIKEKEVFSTEEFEKTCKELNVVKDNLYSDYYLTIKDSYFHIRNVKNMYIEIDGLQYQIDYNKKCIVLYNKGYIHINSLEELKKIVNEYRKSYKIMEETLKKLEILGDFNE